MEDSPEGGRDGTNLPLYDSNRADVPEQSMKAFFDLLRLTLRSANRDALPALIKPVFTFFLDVFDLRHRLQQQGFDMDVSVSSLKITH